MNVKNIILASVLAIVVLAAGSVIGCYFHYNNQEISLRQQSEAQRGKIEGVHDKMWKVLQQGIRREELLVLIPKCFCVD